MDTILEQKKKGQQKFRVKIDDLFKDSIFTKEQNQLSIDVLNQLFMSSHIQGLYSNSKINIQKLIQCSITSQNFTYKKELQKIFKDKKQIKTQQLYNLLNLHDLTEFDIQEQIRKNLFQGQKFSLKKLDQLMIELGINKLNKKDKEILLECFDYNKDNSITKKDLEELMDRAVQKRANQNKVTTSKNQTPLIISNLN